MRFTQCRHCIFVSHEHQRLCEVLEFIPCKSPDEISKILRVESRQLESGLLLEGIEQVLARLVSKGAKSPQDVGNVLRLALVSLGDISN